MYENADVYKKHADEASFFRRSLGPNRSRRSGAFLRPWTAVRYLGSLDFVLLDVFLFFGSAVRFQFLFGRVVLFERLGRWLLLQQHTKCGQGIGLGPPP